MSIGPAARNWRGVDIFDVGLVDTRASLLYASFFLVAGEAGQGRAVQVVKRAKGQEWPGI
jgi:hypothetical protein